MSLLGVVIEKIVAAVSSQGDGKCIPLSEIAPENIDFTTIARELMKRREVMIYYDISEDEYYICRRANTCRRLTVQEIVDEMREKFDSEPVPKPIIMDFIRERAPTKYEAIYNMLLNDGVIEEVNISGMVFVRIVK
ncbi:MAG: hypothetical protein GXO10_00370 [Crenarchaeota archaeon]|nr:hypothetical protein [Thermoproteota archaeon]